MPNAVYQENYVLNKFPWYCHQCSTITHRAHKGNSSSGSSSKLNNSVILKSHLADSELPIGVNNYRPILQKQSSYNAGEGSSAETSMGNIITYDRFQSLLDDKFNQMRDYLDKLVNSQIKTAITNLEQEFTKTTDFLKEEQNDIKSDVTRASERIKELESQKLMLESDINDLNHRLLVLEKSSRSRNVEIQAVPEKKSENVIVLVKKLYEVLNLPLGEHEVCAARRVAKFNRESHRPRNILITLQSERQRDNLISAFKRFNKSNPRNPITSSTIGVPGDSQIIYVSEHLSAQCKNLHAAVRKYAKEHSFKYVWVKYGRVYLRKDDNGPAIHVKTVEDLKKIV